MLGAVVGLSQVVGGAAAGFILLVSAGSLAFKLGRLEESVMIFDAAAAVGYPRALLWQRGISLYYLDRFSDGAAQFRKDVDLNPNDTEESVWAMVCEARELGFDSARVRMQTVGEDPRPVMGKVYSLFRGGEDEAAAKMALEQSAAEGGMDGFYAALYLGLFCEARGEDEAARRWIKLAVASDYAQAGGDYMADVARVHSRLRSWD